MKRIYLICAIMLTFACPSPSQHVTFHMLNGASKSSVNGGVTWVYNMPKTGVVNFVRMDGVVKTSCDNGSKWMFLSAKSTLGTSVRDDTEIFTSDHGATTSWKTCLDGTLVIPDESGSPPRNVHVADLQGRSIVVTSIDRNVYEIRDNCRPLILVVNYSNCLRTMYITK